MATERMLAEQPLVSESSASAGHPMDSTRILLGLMTLSRRAETSQQNIATPDGLGTVISRGVLRSLLSALHFRDVATIQHSRRVAKLSIGMAQYLGWDPPQQKVLEVASLLHDIGKIGVPDNILFKPGKLSADEAELMALHHKIGVDVLQACRVDNEVLKIIVEAHSHYHGTIGGHRRIGTNISQGARILAVADAYDSLSTDKSYRDAKPHHEVMNVLLEAAGSQFDGNVIRALARWVEKEGLPFADGTAAGQEQKSPTGPAQAEDALEASTLGHIFSYLYLLESLYDGFYLVDSDMRFVVWNLGIERLLGRPSHEVLGQVWNRRTVGYPPREGTLGADRDKSAEDFLATAKPSTQNVRLERADGKHVEVELQSVPLIDEYGQLLGVAEIFRDLSRTSRRPHEFRELKMAASRDSLTGVANRGELETQLAMMITDYSERHDAEPFSVVFVDVDYFKNINDTYGHTAGDQVLIDVASLMQREVNPGELVGRYGGEEFIILCPGTTADQAVRRAEQLRLALPSAEIGGLKDVQITASFGVTQVESGDSIESIFRRADKALYIAKATGRNRTLSLTSDELAATEAREQAETKPNDPFVFHGSFQACIAADMIVYKLGGFVTDHNARLTEVTPKRASVRIGSSGLLPFWGKSVDRQPVELVIEFGNEAAAATRSQRVASKQVTVQVQVRPLGWIKDPAVFDRRAHQILRVLRSYFAAG